MSMFHVAQPLPDLKRTTVIEASAGTGKTWMIAALAVRYVAEGRATIDQILIVTFTRLATSELKDRIRMRFVEVHRELLSVMLSASEPYCADGAERGDTLVQALIGGVDLPELHDRIQRLQRAISSFDQATISTIHGFCQSVLTGLGISQQVAPLENLTTELTALNSEIAHDVFLAKYAREQNDSNTWSLAQSVVHKIVEEPATAILEPQQINQEGEKTRAKEGYEFASAARAEFGRRARDRNITTYSDFLELLKEAVGNGDTAASAVLRHRWPVVLVDEFQDTDPTQWQIFKNSFHQHSALILIGDPKQAIYGFRGADVHTYSQAVSQAHERFTLATNYRSTPRLIESFNEIWSGAKLGENISARDVVPPQTALQQDVYFRCAEVEAVSAVESGEAKAETAAPTFQVRVPALADVSKAISAGAPGQQRAITADLTHLIRSMLLHGEWRSGSAASSSSRVKPEDFAVLCASNVQCETIARSLRAAEIPVSFASGSVSDTAAAQDLRWLLSAMINPSRQSLTHRVALGPFFGYLPSDLLEESTTDHVAEQIGEWNQLLTAAGLSAVIDAASSEGLAAQAAKVREADRYLSDLRHLAELSRDAGLSADDGPGVFLAWLEGGLAEAGTERVPDNDGGAVRVLTIHKAKGLQFPIVMLPFSSYKGKALTAPYHLHDESDGKRKIAIADVGNSREQATKQGTDERLRTWYVATTRAQSHVITWCMPHWPTRPYPAQQLILLERKPGEQQAHTAIEKSDWNGVLGALSHWKHITTTPMKWTFSGPNPQSNRDPGAREKSASTFKAQPFSRTIDRTWRRTSYSGLSAEAERRREWSHNQLPTSAESTTDERIDPVEANVDPGSHQLVPRIADAGSAGLAESAQDRVAAPEPSPMANLPKGNRFGSLVHDILEQLDPGQPDFREQLPGLITDYLKRWPVAMDAAQIAQLSEALVAVCTTPLGPLFNGVTLADLGAANRLPELSFDMPMAGGSSASQQYGKPKTLAAIAEILREYLKPGDPVLPYAEELEQDAYAATVLQGYLTGSIDAVLRNGNSFIVVDYKTNWLGGSQEPLTLDHYGPEQLQQAMNGSSYPLQALLYAVAAHRFLRWRIADYDPEIHLGGVAYLYLRGMGGPTAPVTHGQVHGVFSWKPPAGLVEKLSELLDAKTPVHPEGATRNEDGE